MLSRSNVPSLGCARPPPDESRPDPVSPFVEAMKNGEDPSMRRNPALVLMFGAVLGLVSRDGAAAGKSSPQGGSGTRGGKPAAPADRPDRSGKRAELPSGVGEDWWSTVREE